MDVKDFYDNLTAHGINFFCGVPDSLLKSFCAYISDNTDEKHHIITANEGNAIALATGHYLATGTPALVYMQNSGIGNCVNPLLSLNDEEVYGIPVLMLIGWRGEPDKKDEPQHIKQGKLTCTLLNALGIEYSILPVEKETGHAIIEKAINYMTLNKKPYAIIVQAGTFETYTLKNRKINNFKMKREEAICEVAKSIPEDSIIVSTTGQISRELYEYRKRNGMSHKNDFLTVGSMGHASSIALGIALEKTTKHVYCFDGDGAAIMHLGSLPVIASRKLYNFKHIIFNNEAHDSVGGQPTCADTIGFVALAKSCGYKKAYSVSTKKELKEILPDFAEYNGTCLLEIQVTGGARQDLGRPKEKPVENKEIFMAFLQENKTFIGKNSIRNLSKILKHENPKKVLVFNDKNSFKKFQNVLLRQLAGFNHKLYNDFSTNPKEIEIQKAIDTLGNKYDIVIAIGGGSVIDFAKLYKFASDKNKKLIAIPTTAGTGSEATKFAVEYVNGVKKSIEDRSILPDYAIVDSTFVEKNPTYLKACSAIDAYCQAIESFWSVNSTPESVAYATQAIELCRDYLVKYVNSSNPGSAQKMSLASNLAGKAINISKTTAAHAFSYILTSTFNIPHGHAVALSIARLMDYNLNIDEKTNIDKRGVEFVKKQINTLYSLIGIDSSIAYFKKLFDSIGLEYDLHKLGIHDIEVIVHNTDPQRLANNPRIITDQDIKKLFLKY